MKKNMKFGTCPILINNYNYNYNKFLYNHGTGELIKNEEMVDNV